MSSESSYIFMLRAGGSELEVSHNEQSDDVYISEAQIFLKGDHVEGGGLFFIDEVYDMDKLISYLSEIREKMVKYYAAKSAQSLAIASGPYCTQCGNPQTKEEIGARISICFDCEKKQIIQAADSFKPLSQDGLCLALGCYNPRSPMKHYCETHTPYVGVDKQYPAKRPLICLVKSCDRPCVDDSGYCSTHKEDHEPIRRKITPNDLTKPGC